MVTGDIKMKNWTVYMLCCADGSFYTGITTDLDRRLREHNTGNRLASAYTRSRRPVRVVYQETRPGRSAAQKREAQLKQLSREEKQKLLQTVTTEKV